MLTFQVQLGAAPRVDVSPGVQGSARELYGLGPKESLESSSQAPLDHFT